MSDCRSFGSNFRPSSQSRKISIGVLVDSLAKRKPGGNKEDQDKQANAERIKPSFGVSTGGKDKGDAVRTSKGNQTEDNEQVKSPWITFRSLHRETLSPETASLQKEASNPREKKLNTVKDVPEISSFSFSQNQNINAHNVGSEQKKFDGIISGQAYKRKGRKDDNSQRVEEFNCANKWKDKVELEHKADKTENIQTETLKKKLHELFATVSSPKSQQSSLQSHKVGSNNSKQKRSADHGGDTAVKHRQNSVDVEIVSDNPDKTVKRPATHSLIQKRAPAKVQLANSKINLSSKQKHGDNIFSFGEGRSAKLDGAVNNGSLLPRQKKNEKKSSKIDPHQISSPEEETADEIESLPDSSSEKGGENLEKVQEKESFHSPMPNETNERVNFDNPTSPGKWDKQEDDGNISLRNFAHAQDDFQSPTFRFNTPILNTSSSPTPKTVEIERGTCSPVPFERGFSIRNIGSFRSFQTSGPASTKSSAEAQSSDDTEKHTASSLRNRMPGKETIDAVNEHSEPSSSASEEQFSETFKDGSPIINRYDRHRENLISPETVISEKPNFEHCPIKRLRKEDKFLLYFSSEGAGTGESYWFQESLEENQEDELTRAITLLALALESFKRKMDSATRKKSSEILMSISEEMKSILLKAESQIESDVGKMTSLGKTKRKRLETRLQEQQEQLKLILEKFKEDIHHHLLDCNSILEGMESHQNELKGIMKKQKVSHQKLLMHVEETAKIQLNNAERRITAVHEASSKFLFMLVVAFPQFRHHVSSTDYVGHLQSKCLGLENMSIQLPNLVGEGKDAAAETCNC
ncbi:putative Phytochrome interacting factor 3 [Hibiscus syriacus]|uniref:Phytochrome interacting factor 3 n=1 Tax=Hibiscus syriacus TaxID=106335 RepID=A0A6A3A231_HIBSY|nr:putative Phytochrome interacting factor 3 [Hibiscus syriacus]